MYNKNIKYTKTRHEIFLKVMRREIESLKHNWNIMLFASSFLVTIFSTIEKIYGKAKTKIKIYKKAL